MIPDHELDRYLNRRGRLPEIWELADRVRDDHPEWGDITVFNYVTMLYHASAARLRAETDRMMRAERLGLETHQPHAKPENRKSEPSWGPRITLLEDIPEGNIATVDGVRYEEYLVVTRPIRLAGRELKKVPAMIVPQPFAYQGGPDCSWTTLGPGTPFKNRDGSRNWRKTGGALQREVEELRRLDRLERSAEDLAVIERLGAWDESWRGPTLAVVTFDVPPAGIRAGDVLMRCDPERKPERIWGHWFGLSLGDYAALREAVREAGDDALRDITPRFVWSRDDGIQAFIQDRRKWGHRLKKWHSRLFVIRPFTHTVSAPIYAVSDEAAIFDLLTDVGCRMPAGGTQ